MKNYFSNDKPEINVKIIDYNRIIVVYFFAYNLLMN